MVYFVAFSCNHRKCHKDLFLDGVIIKQAQVDSLIVQQQLEVEGVMIALVYLPTNEEVNRKRFIRIADGSSNYYILDGFGLATSFFRDYRGETFFYFRDSYSSDDFFSIGQFANGLEKYLQGCSREKRGLVLEGILSLVFDRKPINACTENFEIDVKNKQMENMLIEFISNTNGCHFINITPAEGEFIITSIKDDEEELIEMKIFRDTSFMSL